MNETLHRELLRQIHQDSDIIWWESEEEHEKSKEKGMGGDTILEFIKNEVWLDFDTKKWCFQNKQFKRKGQAEKAAFQYFKAHRG